MRHFMPAGFDEVLSDLDRLALPSGAPPSRVETWSRTHSSSLAVSTSAGYGVPPSIIGVGSPIRRLNSRATRSGSLRARRLAGSPVRIVSSDFKKMTEGIVGARLPSEQISSWPSRCTAAAV